MIIGITGPTGAGKDTAAEYLRQRLQIPHHSGGDMLRSMLIVAGLEPKKSVIGDFGTFIRTHYGADAVLNRILKESNDSAHVIISGFRSPEEARLIKEKGGIILYIDSPADVRYARVATRAKDYEDTSAPTLQSIDAQEFSSTDPMAENLATVSHIADEVIVNAGTLEELQNSLDGAITRFSLNT